MATLGGKKLTQLRVVDLRAELEKRGLDKSGLKNSLVERLEKSMTEESGEFTSEINESATDMHETQNGEEVKPTNEDALPEDFSGFIVLDSDDSDQEDKEESITDKGNEVNEVGDTGIEDKDEEVKEQEEEDEEPEEDPDQEQLDFTEEKEVDGEVADDEELSVEFEFQGEETNEANQEDDDKAQDEEVIDANGSKKEEESEAVVSQSKPNDNQLSLSMFVNADDVQDDLDEDLKELEKKKAEKETKEAEEEEENVDEEMETDEKKTEDDGGDSVEKVEDMTVEEEKTNEGDEAKENEADKAKEGSADEKSGEASEEIKDKETSEPKLAEVTKENKEEKKEVKEKVKKEEPVKKTVKKDEKKPEKTDSKDEKKTAEVKKAADAKKKEAGKSLWVSNLSSMTRAADLKTRFTQYGKVVGAKIVTNSKAPGAQCFGLVTMSTSEEAAKCIQHLHRTEMHGRNITVDRAKGDRLPTATAAIAKKAAAKKEAAKKEAAKKEAAKKDANKSTAAKAKDDKAKEKTAEKKPGDKAVDKAKTTTKTTTKAAGKESDAKGEKGKSDTTSKTSHRSASGDKKEGKDVKKSSSSSRRVSPRRSDGRPEKPLKSLEDVRRERRERQIRERRERERRDRVRRERERVARERAMERERERIRERERERRRLQVLLREKEERERQERLRLERERQRQRELERQRERERQERERERLLQEKRLREDRERLERERERLERERLQRIERERLERQKIEERRGQKRPGETFTRDRSPTRGPGYWQDTKRPAPDRSGDRDFFSGASGRERGSRDVPETRPVARPVATRERRSDPRVSGHSAPKREEPSRDDHRRSERVPVGRSSRESPRERESRDRRTAWEGSGSIGGSGDPQKGLNLLLQRAGVSGILGGGGGTYGDRSGASLAKPLGADVSLSRERPGDSWNGRGSTHSRPLMSQSITQSPASNPSSRVGGRPPVASDGGRGWPSSTEKDRDRAREVRERDRGVATREVSRYSMSTGGSVAPSLMTSAHSLGHDRSRPVVPASRSNLPPRMMSQHSTGQPMGVTGSLIDGRRGVAMSGRSEPFRSGVGGMPRSGGAARGGVRRY